MSVATRMILFGALALGAAAANLDVLRELWALSLRDNSASHVVLIPFVSVALVLWRRDEIFASVNTNWRGGLGVILGGTGLAVAARLLRPFAGRQEELSVLTSALLAVWVGGFLLLFGWKAAAAARFALGFLVFTIPIPTFMIDGATELLKRGSTEAVATLFSLTGTPFHREAFTFSLPRLSIEVADACSGIRSSIALVLTALLAGHMLLDRAWKRLLLVAAVLPIAILKNGLRIVSLSLLAIHTDPSFLAGRLHTDGGIAFFLLALALLLPILTVLRRSQSAHGPTGAALINHLKGT